MFMKNFLTVISSIYYRSVENISTQFAREMEHILPIFVIGDFIITLYTINIL